RETNEMARWRQSGNGRLEDALATVLQTQASMHQVQVRLQQTLGALQQTHASAQENVSSLQQTMTAFLAQIAEMRAVEDRRWAETLERFARIEAILLVHSRILQEHGRILERLPDAVREKICFRGTGQAS